MAYYPTARDKELESEYLKTLSSEELCEYSMQADNDYYKLYRYMKWLEERVNEGTK